MKGKIRSSSTKLIMSMVMLIADIIMICLGIIVVETVLSMFSFDINFTPFRYSIVLSVLCALIFSIFRLYPPVCMAPAEELRRIFLSCGMVFAIEAIVQIASRESILHLIAIALSYFASVTLVLAGRWCVRTLYSKTSWWGMPVAILGAGHRGKMIVDRLIKWPRLGLKPVAIFDDDPNVGTEYRGIPIISGIETEFHRAVDTGIKYAIVAMPNVPRDRVMQIIDETIKYFPYLLVVPDSYGISGMWISVRDLNGILTLESQQKLIMPGIGFIKRGLDLAMAICGGLIILPFILVIALLIKLDSRGPVFYGHERLGKNGKPFKAWKFRSMIMDADKVLADYLTKDPKLQREWNENFKLKKDPRITRIGKFLRKSSLDELPQVWNIITGEMSFVGPRPIVQDEVAKYGSKYELFASVKPGMTGLWQISGRSDIGYEERVELDIYYVRNWSIWLDVYIFFKTFLVIFIDAGAY